MVDSYRVLRPAAEMIVDTVAVEAAQSTGTVIRTGGVALATLLVTVTFSAVAGLAFWLGIMQELKSTGSGGAQFELPLLRKECEDLRRQLDASTRREQGLAAQVRAQHILRQSRDNKARQQIAVEAPSGTQVSLRPDSSFLEPLLREGADAACIEMLLTAFTYDDPRITECAIEAHSRRALVRLLIDQQKAQACKESGRVLQTLVDSNVEVRTVQGRPLWANHVPNSAILQIVTRCGMEGPSQCSHQTVHRVHCDEVGIDGNQLMLTCGVAEVPMA
eukprot:s4496_g4.t2